jgi:hypothetical protein
MSLAPTPTLRFRAGNFNSVLPRASRREPAARWLPRFALALGAPALLAGAVVAGLVIGLALTLAVAMVFGGPHG